jgi:hypothetical protein
MNFDILDQNGLVGFVDIVDDDPLRITHDWCFWYITRKQKDYPLFPLGSSAIAIIGYWRATFYKVLYNWDRRNESKLEMILRTNGYTDLLLVSCIFPPLSSLRVRAAKIAWPVDRCTDNYMFGYEVDEHS